MTESEILQLRFDGTYLILSVISVLFTFVCAYAAALYLFLAKSVFFLRATVFAILTSSFIFLGAVTFGCWYLMEGLSVAWSKIPHPQSEITSFGIKLTEMTGLTTYTLAVLFGCFVVSCVYSALFHMTFIHRWASDE